jgi:hypothetical protein
MSVARLLSVTAGLDAPRIFERSVKLGPGGLSEDRGLVSMDCRALYPAPRTTLTEICTALGCPDPAPLLDHLAAAQAVHFGADGEIGKCYLEFPPDSAPLPDLVFLALKWQGDAVGLSHYKSLARQSHAEKAAMIDTLVIDHVVRAVARRCLDLARDGDPDGTAVVLHVTDPDSRRASIDISVADARRSLAEAASFLEPLFSAFDLDGAAFLQTHGAARFGHLAVGMDRHGGPFATIYFGAQAL